MVNPTHQLWNVGCFEGCDDHKQMASIDFHDLGSLMFERVWRMRHIGAPKHCVWRRASVTGCQLWSGKIPHMQRWSKTNFILDEMKWRRWSKHKKQEINTLRELRVCLSFGHWTPSLMFICTLYALYMHFLVHISIFWSNHGTNTVNTIFCLS